MQLPRRRRPPLRRGKQQRHLHWHHPRASSRVRSLPRPREHPPELVWEFPRGVTRSVKAALEAIEVNGRHIRVVGQIVDPVNPPLPVPPPPQNQDESP
jgi:hypothetical protein